MKDTGIIKGEPTKENGLIPVELGDGSLIYAQWIPNAEPVVGQAVDIERTASGSMLATAKNSYNFNQLFQKSGLQKFAKRASWDVDFANGKVWNEPMGKPKKLNIQLTFLFYKDNKARIITPVSDDEVLLTPKENYLGVKGYVNYLDNKWSASFYLNKPDVSGSDYSYNYSFTFLDRDAQQTYELILELPPVLGMAEQLFSGMSNSKTIFINPKTAPSAIVTSDGIATLADVYIPAPTVEDLTYVGRFNKWFTSPNETQINYGSISQDVTGFPYPSLYKWGAIIKESILSGYKLLSETVVINDYQVIYGHTGIAGEQTDVVKETEIFLIEASGNRVKVDQSPFLCYALSYKNNSESIYNSNTVTVAPMFTGVHPIYCRLREDGKTECKKFIIQMNSGYSHLLAPGGGWDFSWLIGHKINVAVKGDSNSYSVRRGVITSFNLASSAETNTPSIEDITITFESGFEVREYDYWADTLGSSNQPIIYSRDSKSIFQIYVAPKDRGFSANIELDSYYRNDAYWKHLFFLDDFKVVRIQPLPLYESEAELLDSQQKIYGDSYILAYSSDRGCYELLFESFVEFDIDFIWSEVMKNGGSYYIYQHLATGLDYE